MDFDCTNHKIRGCMVCDRCGMVGPCVQKDDFEIIRPQLINCNAIKCYLNYHHKKGHNGDSTRLIPKLHLTYRRLGHFNATSGHLQIVIHLSLI